MTPAEYAEALRLALDTSRIYGPETIPGKISRALLLHQWRPISEAPRDGTWCLLWWPHWSHKPCLGYYSPNYGGHEGSLQHVAVTGTWKSDVALSYGPPPTHFSGLPPPPEVTK